MMIFDDSESIQDITESNDNCKNADKFESIHLDTTFYLMITMKIRTKLNLLKMILAILMTIENLRKK